MEINIKSKKPYSNYFIERTIDVNLEEEIVNYDAIDKLVQSLNEISNNETQMFLSKNRSFNYLKG